MISLFTILSQAFYYYYSASLSLPRVLIVILYPNDYSLAPSSEGAYYVDLSDVLHIFHVELRCIHRGLGELDGGGGVVDDVAEGDVDVMPALV